MRFFDRFYARVHARILEELLRQGTIHKALDVGCGAGGFTALLAQAISGGGAVVALDTSLEHLAATRATVGAANRVVYCKGDVEDLQFLGGEFDLLWCSRVIHHHLPDPRRALSEMYRVLRPHGRVAIRESGPRRLFFSLPEHGVTEAFLNRLQDAQDRWFQSTFRSRKPDDAEWQRLLSQAGFKEVRCLEFDYTPVPPADQIPYLFDWLEGFLEINASPEHGNVLEEADIATLEELRRMADPDADGCVLKGRDLGVRVPSAVYVGYK